MPPSTDSSSYNIPNLSRSSSKRKLHNDSENLKPPQASSISPFQPECDTPSFRSSSTSPSAKRLKTSNSSGNLGRSADMSKSMGKGAGPKVIDLTRSAHFQPHTGAKRLVIKNLRTSPKKNVDEYYDQTWEELDKALTSVFGRKALSSPLEVLCRGVEMTCRRGRAEQLFTHLKDRCRTHIDKTLLPGLENLSTSTPVQVLRTVHNYWTVWNEKSVSTHQVSLFFFQSQILIIPGRL